MDEVWARLGLIVGALGVAYATTLVLRSRSKGSPRQVEDSGLRIGVYLFTSATCQDCRPARRKLTEQLGEDGFTEMNWEKEPGVFHRLGVSAVPATLIVESDGSGTLFPGQPEKAMNRLDP